MKKQLPIILLCFGLFINAISAQTVRYVTEKGSGSKDGSSWTNASNDIQSMISASKANDQVWVAKGEYKPTKDFSGNASPSDTRMKTFYIDKPLKLYGGFLGGEKNISERNLKENKTILNGDIDTKADNDSYHTVLFFRSTGSVLDGFTISGGKANVSDFYRIATIRIFSNGGGGLYLHNSNVSVANCTFKDNQSLNFGGGVLHIVSEDEHTSKFYNCVFYNNNSSSGSALFTGNSSSLSSAKIEVINSTFYKNAAVKASEGQGSAFEAAFVDKGGLIKAMKVTPKIHNCIFWENTTDGKGSNPDIINTENKLTAANFSNTITQSFTLTGSKGILKGVDPKFKNAKEFDLNLSISSPAIDAGNKNFLTSVAKDANGNARVLDANIDLGAFESNHTPLRTKIDSTALANIYELIPATSKSKLNWKTAKLLKDWNKITLNEKNRVTSLDLSELEMESLDFIKISEKIKDEEERKVMLDQLVTLDVSNNKLSKLVLHKKVETLNISGNKFDFAALAGLKSKVSKLFLFLNQKPSLLFNNVKKDKKGQAIPFYVDYGKSITLSSKIVHYDGNKYKWTLNEKSINADDKKYTITNNQLKINSADASSAGTYALEITNEAIKGISFKIEGQKVLTQGKITVRLEDKDGKKLNLAFSSMLLQRNATTKQYDTLQKKVGNAGEVVFDKTNLGDYLISNTADGFVTTYYGNTFSWEQAKVLKLAKDSLVKVVMVQKPKEPKPKEGDGKISGVIYDIRANDSGSRALARRRAKRRKCGLRKRRAGGRELADNAKWDLFAYGETNKNGEFEFGYLPEGTYRFFIEFPGVPMDKNSVTEFVIGKKGASDNEFKLVANIDKDKITVESTKVEKALGIANKIDISVFPNPTTNWLNITAPTNGTVAVYNMAGSKLINGETNSKMFVENLESGMYLVKIRLANNEEYSYRFIKK